MSKADEIARGEKLLHTPKALLTSIQQQEKFLFGQDKLAPPCPGCGEALSKVEASPETYRIGFSEGDNYDCPKCKAELRYILPFFGGSWFWQLREPPFKHRLENSIAQAREAEAQALPTDADGYTIGTFTYPPNWPRCPGCGEPALDGKVTCGRATCGASTGSDR